MSFSATETPTFAPSNSFVIEFIADTLRFNIGAESLEYEKSRDILSLLDIPLPLKQHSLMSMCGSKDRLLCPCNFIPKASQESSPILGIRIRNDSYRIFHKRETEQPRFSSGSSERIVENIDAT